MRLATLCTASLLALAAFGCSKSGDNGTQTGTGAEVGSGTETVADPTQATTDTDPSATDMNEDRPGQDTGASGVGMNAPGSANSGGQQPTGPGTEGEDVTTGAGPGVTNSPTGQTGSANIGR